MPVPRQHFCQIFAISGSKNNYDLESYICLEAIFAQIKVPPTQKKQSFCKMYLCILDGDVKDPTAATEDADAAEFVHHLIKSCCKLAPC